MDTVRRPVEVVCKQKLDLAPIPRHKMVGKIVAVLDLPLLLENATGIHVRVSPIFFTRLYVIKSGETKTVLMPSSKHSHIRTCGLRTSWQKFTTLRRVGLPL